MAIVSRLLAGTRLWIWVVLIGACSSSNTVDGCRIPGRCNEADCADQIDEDGDGLTDCEDPDCRTAEWMGTCAVVQGAVCPQTPEVTFRENFDKPLLPGWVQFDPIPPEAPAVVQPIGFLDWQGSGEDNYHGSSMATTEAWTLVPAGLTLRFGVSLPWTKSGFSRGIDVDLGRLASFEPEPAIDTMQRYVRATTAGGIWQVSDGAAAALAVGTWGSDSTTISPLEFHDVEIRVDDSGIAALSIDAEEVAEAPFAVDGFFQDARVVLYGRDLHPGGVPPVPPGEVLVDYVEMTSPGGRPAGCAWGNPVLTPVGDCGCCPPLGIPGNEGRGCPFDGLDVNSPSVVRVGDEYLMFFAGSSGTGLEYGSNVGLARSPDGFEWVKETDADGTPVPVMWAYEWDVIGIYEPFVMAEGDRLVAYVRVSTPLAAEIWRATSEDGGTTWAVDESAPPFGGRPGEWDAGISARASVVALEDRYVMAYSASGSIGLVESADGRTWDDDTRREVEELRPRFAGEMRRCPWLMTAGDRLILLVERSGGFEGSVIDLVYSDDQGVSWQELPGNPLLRERAGDNVQGVSCPSAILEGDLLRVWYSSAPAIGYAEFDLRDVPTGTP